MHGQFDSPVELPNDPDELIRISWSLARRRLRGPMSHGPLLGRSRRGRRLCDCRWRGNVEKRPPETPWTGTVRRVGKRAGGGGGTLRAAPARGIAVAVAIKDGELLGSEFVPPSIETLDLVREHHVHSGLRSLATRTQHTGRARRELLGSTARGLLPPDYASNAGAWRPLLPRVVAPRWRRGPEPSLARRGYPASSRVRRRVPSHLGLEPRLRVRGRTEDGYRCRSRPSLSPSCRPSRRANRGKRARSSLGNSAYEVPRRPLCRTPTTLAVAIPIAASSTPAAIPASSSRKAGRGLGRRRGDQLVLGRVGPTQTADSRRAPA